MIAPPPPLQTVRRTPVALSILTGLAGLGVAVGSGVSGFLEGLSQTSFSSFFWSDTPRIVALVALIGSVLALARHDAGPPLVAGAGAVFAVVVATTVTTEGFDLTDFLDSLTWRAVAFLGGGVAAGLAAVLGLVSLRGRGRPGWGVATLVIGIGVFGCHAMLVGLDDRQIAANVRPTIAIAVVVTVMVIGSFIGRCGALVATAGAACLFPLYSELAEFGSDRRKFAVIAAVCLAAIIVVSITTAVAAARQPVVQYFGQAEVPWGRGDAPEPTQVFPAQAPGPAGTPAYGAPVYGAAVYDAAVYDATQQIPAITEATPVSHFDHTIADDRLPTGLMAAQAAATPTATPTATSAAAATPTAAAAAQWMSDPFGGHQLRYWDGSAWTEHVSDFGTTAVDRV